MPVEGDLVRLVGEAARFFHFAVVRRVVPPYTKLLVADGGDFLALLHDLEVVEQGYMEARLSNPQPPLSLFHG